MERAVEGKREGDCTGLCQIQVLVLAQKICAQNYQQQVFALVFVFVSVRLRWWGQPHPHSHIHIHIATSTAAAAEIGAKFTDASKNIKTQNGKQLQRDRLWMYECGADFVRHFKGSKTPFPHHFPLKSLQHICTNIYKPLKTHSRIKNSWHSLTLQGEKDTAV